MAYDFVLDPKKNFALVRYVYSQSRALTTEDDEFSMTYEVLDHRQIAEGIWYPIHFTMTTRHSKEYVTQIRSLYHSRVDDDYRPTKSEVVLTNAAILHGADAEVNLTVVLPDGVDIRELDKE
ncbi:MAG TPA: hypothetical protein VL171_03105 [Verrucomicrobiae bacterium]|nr:hypothetical protein [Verrucomicrobiae bacterium]